MSLNLIDLIKGQLGPALVSQVASQNGESEAGIQKAISGLLPAVIGGLANNSNNSILLDAFSNASSSGLLGNLLGGSSNNPLITTVINSLFGDKLNGLLGTVASFAGISNNSTNSLLNLVTGATLGSVGKYAADNNLDRLGVSNLLSEQKGIISSLLPAGLSLASLGFGNIFGSDKTPDFDNVKLTSANEPKVDVTRSERTRTHTPPPTYNEDNGGGSIWKWLLPLLLLGLISWFLFKQCDKKSTETTVVTSDTIAVNSDDTLVIEDNKTVTKVDEDIDLNGVTLKGYRGGLEDSMINFLKSGSYDNAANDDALKDVWYDFDHVNFKMGSSTELEAGSKEQLDNLVAILKAYPNAKVKVGGYTDKTGNEENNKKLSQARADFIKNYLTDANVGGQVTGADGYGSDFATQPATATDAERAVDRKMAVRFAK